MRAAVYREYGPPEVIRCPRSVQIDHPGSVPDGKRSADLELDLAQEARPVAGVQGLAQSRLGHSLS